MTQATAALERFIAFNSVVLAPPGRSTQLLRTRGAEQDDGGRLERICMTVLLSADASPRINPAVGAQVAVRVACVRVGVGLDPSVRRAPAIR
jgi:hypothetical protein